MSFFYSFCLFLLLISFVFSSFFAVCSVLFYIITFCPFLSTLFDYFFLPFSSNFWLFTSYFISFQQIIYFEVFCRDLSRKCFNVSELLFLEWKSRKNIYNILYLAILKYFVEFFYICYILSFIAVYCNFPFYCNPYWHHMIFILAYNHK